MPTPEPALPSPRAGSAQEKPTLTALRYHPAAFLPVGSCAVMSSGVRSMLMPVTVPAPLFPARSLMLADAPRLRPSPLMVLLTGWVAASIPDRPSAPVQAMETSPRYHSPPLESPVGAPVSEGAVLSMLILSTVTELALPATSWVSPRTDWSEPSLETVWSGPQPAMPSTPESASEQLKVTLTSVLFQSAEFGPGARCPVIVGGTVSTLTAMVLVASWASSLSARSTLQ